MHLFLNAECLLVRPSKKTLSSCSWDRYMSSLIRHLNVVPSRLIFTSFASTSTPKCCDTVACDKGSFSTSSPLIQSSHIINSLSIAILTGFDSAFKTETIFTLQVISSAHNSHHNRFQGLNRLNLIALFALQHMQHDNDKHA
jgi:hypothetical protein